MRMKMASQSVMILVIRGKGRRLIQNVGEIMKQVRVSIHPMFDRFLWVEHGMLPERHQATASLSEAS